MLKDIQEKIIRLKKENGAAILAHSYQTPDILEIADYTGDSFKLSELAATLENKTVIVCGVRFMAETIKLLSPQKKVLLPVFEATCPMAEQISPQRVIDFKKENPDFIVVAYINTTAELKAVCDVCVTSSSALKIVSSLKSRNILFIPDRNLGGYIKAQLPQKNIVLWDGFCPVHDSVTEADCKEIKARYPSLKILMHPELPAEVLKYGDVIGSTAAILDYALSHDENCVIGTEKSISDFLKLKKTQYSYPMLSKKLICPDMKLISIADVLSALENGGYEVTLSDGLMEKARRPIDEMIRLGK